MAGEWMLTDGTSVVSLNLEWNYRNEDSRIESAHRTRAGAMYRYVWGVYKRRKFDVENVTSADMCQVNSWFYANTPLVLFDASSVVVISGYLVNASVPIDEFIKPYTDEYKGTIELESY